MEAILIAPKKKADLWYREPWLLLVLGLPLLVICASLYTAFLAFSGADKVIAPDYYKRGLAINKDIRRDLVASERKLGGDLQLDGKTGAVSLQLSGEGVLPPGLSLEVSRALGQGTGEIVMKTQLHQSAPGIYSGTLPIPAGIGEGDRALWHVKLESTEWRLSYGWHGSLQMALHLKAPA